MIDLIKDKEVLFFDVGYTLDYPLSGSWLFSDPFYELAGTVFIDDRVENLDGAKEIGITPILIAANPASDVETSYYKIHSLSELLK